RHCPPAAERHHQAVPRHPLSRSDARWSHDGGRLHPRDGHGRRRRQPRIATEGHREIAGQIPYRRRLRLTPAPGVELAGAHGNGNSRLAGFGYITDMLESALDEARPLEVRGRVTQVVGTIIKAVVPGVKVGELCILKNPWEENWQLLAEVVGFSREAA